MSTAMGIVFSGWAAILRGRSWHRDTKLETDDQTPDGLPESPPPDHPQIPTLVPARWPSSGYPGRAGN
jgi:hypothetical protein